MPANNYEHQIYQWSENSAQKLSLPERNPQLMHPITFPVLLRHLRQTEEIILNEDHPGINGSETAEVVDFLHGEYQRESCGFPYHAPPFDPDAALWGAEIIYFTARFILFREHDTDEIEQRLPDFKGLCNAPAQLSADLCLRFLPDLYDIAYQADPEDTLTDRIVYLLRQWHYSALMRPGFITQPDLTSILADQCMTQLYINRIIGSKDLKLAQHPDVKPLVWASLGIHGKVFWPEFTELTAV